MDERKQPNYSAFEDEEDEVEYTIEHLSDEQKEELKTSFIRGEGYNVSKDKFEDIYEGWLEGLSLSNLKRILNI